MSAYVRTLTLLLCISYICLTSCQDRTIPVDQPNIIVIFADDQGYADIGCYGATKFETPHLDELAENGIRLTDFYVPAPVCTPSRAALLTGRYPIRSGLHEGVIFPFSTNGLDSNEHTLPKLLRTAGYDTWCIGKWHLGHQEQYMPWHHGFNSFYGIPYSHDMDSVYYERWQKTSPSLPVYRDSTILTRSPDPSYLTKQYTEEAIRKIKAQGDAPFFLYLPHSMPHVPIAASPAFAGKSERGLYGDVIMELDWSTGQIVQALKDIGAYENTIIIYTSDNGPSLGRAKPLRGWKGETWEGGQRVPCIISWPAANTNGDENESVFTTMDLLPTLTFLAKAHTPEDLFFDGSNISDLFIDPDDFTITDRPFFYYSISGHVEAVRLNNWKLHIRKERGWREEQDGAFPISLYDLDQDPGEAVNVADEYVHIVQKLQRVLDAHEIDPASDLNGTAPNAAPPETPSRRS